MDATTLKTRVETAVMAKIDKREPFTNADISHPIISEDNSVRHRQVRDVIDEMLALGTIQNEEYTSSTITVYPKPGKAQNARLFHPDDPTFDPNSYTAIHQELHRTGSGDSTISTTRGFNMIDSVGDDGSNDGPVAITSTVSGQQVTAQCLVQPKEGSLNIPRRLIKQAGFSAGDALSINKENGGVITIRKGGNDQKVDDEGRIRLHGSTINWLNAAAGSAVNALLVSPSGEASYIQVQP